MLILTYTYESWGPILHVPFVQRFAAFRPVSRLDSFQGQADRWDKKSGGWLRWWKILVGLNDMDVSENGRFSPQIIHFYRVFHYKPSILGEKTLFLETSIWAIIRILAESL